MCYGKEGKIFSINCIEEFPIVEIGCKKKQFVYGETVETKMKSVFDLCYISTKDILVILTHKKNSTPDEFSDEDPGEHSEEKEKDKKKEDPAMIRAVQVRNGKVVWEVKEVDGMETSGHGVIYSHKYDVLLVADGSNRRILVLQPESGEHLQTIDLSSHVGVSMAAVSAQGSAHFRTFGSVKEYPTVILHCKFNKTDYTSS